MTRDYCQHMGFLFSGALWTPRSGRAAPRITPWMPPFAGRSRSANCDFGRLRHHPTGEKNALLSC
jgi:hypothetical protein